MNRIVEMQNLFQKWMSEAHHVNNPPPFNIDGIVNNEIWNVQKKKVLFIFKEAWHKNNNSIIIEENKYDLCSDLNNNSPWGMWNRVAEWTYAILNTEITKLAAYKQMDSDEKKQLLKQIAVINIKKSDGKPNSNDDELRQYAKTDKDYIKKQIELIEPDILVCGNTLKFIQNILLKPDTPRNENWHYWNEDRLILDYYHPANQYPSLLNFYGLAAIYQQALIEKS